MSNSAHTFTNFRIHRYLLCLVILLGGCTTTPFTPKSIDEVPFRDRAVTQEEDGVKVTAAVPSAQETKQLFATSLYRRGIQPVWLEIENNSTEPVVFMPVGLDSNYFSPFEAAANYTSIKTRNQVERYFFQNGVNTRILPGKKRSGFIFTHLDEGTKSFNVDIVGERDTWPFTFFIQVPGLRIDHHDVDFRSLYSADQFVDYSADQAQALIDALQALPCCVVDKKGENTGDPLNLVVIGNPQELYYAFLRAGWDETETITTSTSMKTIASFFSGSAYRYSPISALYVYGRPQDIALQKIRENIHERNHLRLWMTPMSFEGERVWIGQISRDIGVRFTTKTITTHKIDPDVDETREFLLENLAYNQVLAKIAYVSGTGEAPIESPRGNLTGDPYFTDGLRVVLWISSESIDMDDIAGEQWHPPPN